MGRGLGLRRAVGARRRHPRAGERAALPEGVARPVFDDRIPGATGGGADSARAPPFEPARRRCLLDLRQRAEPFAICPLGGCGRRPDRDLSRSVLGLLPHPPKMNGSKGLAPWRSSKRRSLLVGPGRSSGAVRVQAIGLGAGRDPRATRRSSPRITGRIRSNNHIMSLKRAARNWADAIEHVAGPFPLSIYRSEPSIAVREVGEILTGSLSIHPGSSFQNRRVWMPPGSIAPGGERTSPLPSRWRTDREGVRGARPPSRQSASTCLPVPLHSDFDRLSKTGPQRRMSVPLAPTEQFDSSRGSIPKSQITVRRYQKNSLRNAAASSRMPTILFVT